MFLKIFTFVKNKLNLLFSRFMCQMLVKMYCKMNIIKKSLIKNRWNYNKNICTISLKFKKKNKKFNRTKIKKLKHSYIKIYSQ